MLLLNIMEVSIILLEILAGIIKSSLKILSIEIIIKFLGVKKIILN